MICLTKLMLLLKQMRTYPFGRALLSRRCFKGIQQPFSKELHKISNSEITLGPTVIMFHETNFTNVLPQADERTGKSPETIIRDHIASLDQVIYNLNILNWVPQPYNKHRPKTRLYRGLSVKTCWDTLCRRCCT